MTVRYRYTDINGEFGCEITFENSGEYVPSHQHQRRFSHTTKCLSGRALLEVIEERPRTIVAGKEESAWDSTKPHTITAMESNTVIFNRLLERPDEATVADLLTDSGVVE